MTPKLLWTYFQFLRRFRNGHAMIRALRGGPPCDLAVLWDGTRLTHPPGKDGMVTVLLDLWVNRGFLRDGFYEPADGDVVIDCGAHVGLFSTLIARSNPRCRVVALEPNDEVLGHLEGNIRSAGLGNVAVHRLGVGRVRGHGRMATEAVGRTIDRRLLTGEGDTGDGAVPVVTLADLPGLAGAEHVDFLKVDIEGGEYDLFHDAGPELLGRFERIALEYHDNLRPGTLALLRDRFGPTHDVKVYPDNDACGILLARRRPRG